jgi:hypothetical protein
MESALQGLLRLLFQITKRGSAYASPSQEEKMFIPFLSAIHARELADKPFSFVITESISRAKSCLLNVSIHID